MKHAESGWRMKGATLHPLLVTEGSLLLYINTALKAEDLLKQFANLQDDNLFQTPR
jgi:hypothetical protein